MRKILSALFLSVALFVSTSNAQQSSSFSVSELNPYLSAYLRPFMIGTAAGMGHGWAHEARVHKKWGFDVSLSAVAVCIPDAALLIKPDALSAMEKKGYSFHDKNGKQTKDYEFQTFASGHTTSGHSIKKNIGIPGDNHLLNIPEFENVIPFPYSGNVAIQLAVGLPKGTEIMGRFLPNVGKMGNLGLDKFDVKLWGIGLKHDIKQWIPGLKGAPLLKISALLAYSKFNIDIIDNAFITPSTILKTIPHSLVNDYYNSKFDKQGYHMMMSSLTGSILVGANIPVLRPFIGIGFNKANAKVGLTGNLPSISFQKNENKVVVAIDKEGLNIDEAETLINFQAGLNIKLGFFAFHAQYTLQKYSMLSAGIAFGFR